LRSALSAAATACSSGSDRARSSTVRSGVVRRKPSRSTTSSGGRSRRCTTAPGEAARDRSRPTVTSTGCPRPTSSMPQARAALVWLAAPRSPTTAARTASSVGGSFQTVTTSSDSGRSWPSARSLASPRRDSPAACRSCRRATPPWHCSSLRTSGGTVVTADCGGPRPRRPGVRRRLWTRRAAVHTSQVVRARLERPVRTPRPLSSTDVCRTARQAVVSAAPRVRRSRGAPVRPCTRPPRCRLGGRRC
jgi:hypothetical protein